MIGGVKCPRVHVLNTGGCLALQATMIRGGQWRVVECPCLVGLLLHPTRGWVLWDTGYAPRMWQETRRWPYRLYRTMTPLRLAPEQSVVRQLSRLGVSPEAIQTVIVSHFHADHLCGLRDFPEARFVATAAAWSAATEITGVQALRKGYIPALVPDDFGPRAELLDEFRGAPLGELGPTHDLFGDGSLRLVSLPGHARGQIGMLAQSERGPLLFTADGAWLRDAVRERRPPHPFTHLFVDDAAVAQATLNRLHAVYRQFPDLTLVPTHCPEACGDLAEKL